MKYTRFFAVFVCFLTIMQACIAMEYNSQSSLPFIKALGAIEPNSVVKYSDGNTILAYNDQGCKSIDIRADIVIKQLTNSMSCGMAINHNKQQVALAHYNNNKYFFDTVAIYDIFTGDRRWSVTENSNINSFRFDKNNIFIQLSSSIKIYDYVNNAYRGIIPFPQNICFATVPSLSLMCVVERALGKIHVFNTDNLKPLEKALDLNKIITSCQISPDGIAAIMHQNNQQISIVDLKENKLVGKIIAYPHEERRFDDILLFLPGKKNFSSRINIV